MSKVLTRVKYLESLLSTPFEVLNKKYYGNFSKYATHMGNGVYSWEGIYSSDTRELYLMGILRSEGIEFDEEE